MGKRRKNHDTDYPSSAAFVSLSGKTYGASSYYHGYSSRSDYMAGERFRRKLQAEAQLLAGLGHPCAEQLNALALALPLASLERLG